MVSFLLIYILILLSVVVLNKSFYFTLVLNLYGRAFLKNCKKGEVEGGFEEEKIMVDGTQVKPPYLNIFMLVLRN
jgi:hypothetical protein